MSSSTSADVRAGRPASDRTVDPQDAPAGHASRGAGALALPFVSAPGSWRSLLGIGILAIGLYALAGEIAQSVQQIARHHPGWLQAIKASTIAGAATGLGAIAVLIIGRLEERGLAIFMALAGGTMFAAAVFSLVKPALATATGPLALDAAAAIGGGYLLMALVDRMLPHQHPLPGAPATGARNALALTVVAIAVHNVPEGFAVGAGFGGDGAIGWSTAVAIGMQNVPEGLIVATALWSLGTSRGVAAAGALATGLVEPLGAAAGVMAAGLSDAALPVALGLAGGAMLYVVLDELVPASFRGAPTRAVPLGFGGGFLALALLIGAI